MLDHERISQTRIWLGGVEITSLIQWEPLVNGLHAGVSFHQPGGIVKISLRPGLEFRFESTEIDERGDVKRKLTGGKFNIDFPILALEGRAQMNPDRSFGEVYVKEIGDD